MAELCAKKADVFCWAGNAAPRRWNTISANEDDLKKDEPLPHMGLMLVHGNDADAFDATSISRSCVVWYGGHRGDWRDYPKLLSRGRGDDGKVFEVQEDAAITLTERDVADLIAYAGAIAHVESPTKPRCLLPPPDPSVLNAIAILCQGFVAAGISAGKIAAGDELVSMIGWSRLQAVAMARLSGRLSDLWPEVNRVRWWRQCLGVSKDSGEGHDDERYRRLLVRLVAALLTNTEANKKLSVKPDQSIEDKTTDELEAALRTLSYSVEIMTLVERLKATGTEQMGVERIRKALNQVTTLLSKQ